MGLVLDGTYHRDNPELIGEQFQGRCNRNTYHLHQHYMYTSSTFVTFYTVVTRCIMSSVRSYVIQTTPLCLTKPYEVATMFHCFKCPWNFLRVKTSQVAESTSVSYCLRVCQGHYLRPCSTRYLTFLSHVCLHYNRSTQSPDHSPRWQQPGVGPSETTYLITRQVIPDDRILKQDDK